MTEPECISRGAGTRQRRVVLCVDDEPRVLAALVRALRLEPYEILGVGGPAEALGLLERHPVDVVLSDERMPGMSGSEFLYQVREILPAAGRILVTGYPGSEVLVRSVVVGADFVMMKPWDELQLKRSIRCLLRLADEGGAGGKGPEAPRRWPAVTPSELRGWS